MSGGTLGFAMAKRFKQIGLAALTAFLALNVWTGSPLLALWIGSRVQGQGPPSMGAVVAVLVALIAISWVLYQALKMTGRAYDDLTGHTPTVRAHAPWLRSMRDERPAYAGVKHTVSVTERIVVLAVILGAAAFEIWFFFFSGSSIGAN
jgi:hypothetical protein